MSSWAESALADDVRAGKSELCGEIRSFDSKGELSLQTFIPQELHEHPCITEVLGREASENSFTWILLTSVKEDLVQVCLATIILLCFAFLWIFPSLVYSALYLHLLG